LAVFIGRITCRDHATDNYYLILCIFATPRLAEVDNQPGPNRVAGTQSLKIRPHSSRRAQNDVKTFVPEEQVDVPLLFSILDGYFQQRSNHIDRSLRTLKYTYVSTYVAYDVNAPAIHSWQHFCVLCISKSSEKAVFSSFITHTRCLYLESLRKIKFFSNNHSRLILIKMCCQFLIPMYTQSRFDKGRFSDA